MMPSNTATLIGHSNRVWRDIPLPSRAKVPGIGCSTFEKRCLKTLIPSGGLLRRNRRTGGQHQVHDNGVVMFQVPLRGNCHLPATSKENEHTDAPSCFRPIFQLTRLCKDRAPIQLLLKRGKGTIEQAWAEMNRFRRLPFPYYLTGPITMPITLFPFLF